MDSYVELNHRYQLRCSDAVYIREAAVHLPDFDKAIGLHSIINHGLTSIHKIIPPDAQSELLTVPTCSSIRCPTIQTQRLSFISRPQFVKKKFHSEYHMAGAKPSTPRADLIHDTHNHFSFTKSLCQSFCSNLLLRCPIFTMTAAAIWSHQSTTTSYFCALKSKINWSKIFMPYWPKSTQNFATFFESLRTIFRCSITTVIISNSTPPS